MPKQSKRASTAASPRSFLEQPVAQGATTAFVLVEVAFEAAREDMGVEHRLADIDAGDYPGGGLARSCVPVLFRFGATSALRFRSRRIDATDLPPAGVVRAAMSAAAVACVT